ncbi:class I SAM-dependent methyltransferase [Mesorhizobium sp. YR577]|uniref:class I SAM-dependent methyltransferase n=1 Tax=Mesorhizobium sp. YR577 TaxID=1884373 RepID=UPI0008F083C2|nr:class I SAM-dependent methyltransferase [Mesorhizobium sp. YR577]SFU23273.1 Methyltransferase domain-containing protein [Mesorhizobium sp. YR577]
MFETLRWRNSRLKALFRKIAQRVRQHGSRNTAAYVIRETFRLIDVLSVLKLKTSVFDRQNGTDTDGIVPLWRLRIVSPNRDAGVRFQSCDPETLKTAIESLPIDPSDYVFVDLGSGKGRALLVAGGYPFRRVVGVEFSPEMHAIAAANISKCRDQFRARDVQSLYADAATWEFPAENMVVFLYNPFGESVLRTILGNLKSSLAPGSTVYILYLQPVLSEMLENSGFVETVSRSTRDAIYRISPNRSPVMLGIVSLLLGGLSLECWCH